MSNEKIITWTAPEFRYYKKNTAWYITLGAISILVIAFFIIVQKDIFAAITAGILLASIVFFSFQKPELLEIEINQKFLHVGKVTYPYKQLKHFWIVNNLHHRTLNIETSSLINNMIIVEVMDQNEEDIRNFLLRHLPEHHLTTETFAQKISHKLKF